MPDVRETGFEENNLFLDSVVLERGDKKIDLRFLFSELVFFEDIYANTMSGYIKIIDSHNLPETFPIIGEEMLTVKFKTTKKSIFEKTFKIYKCEDYAFNNTKRFVTYKLFFASEQFLTNQTKRLNRSFGSEKEGIRASEIVDTICQKMLDIPAENLKIEKTRFGRHLICPNWTPFQTINYLAVTDLLDGNSDTNDKNSTFLFYEDKEGFKFVSWSTIIEDRLHKNKVIESLTLTDKTKFSDVVSERSVDPRQILSFVMPTCFDQISNTSKGLFANRYIYHDIIKKEQFTLEWNYDSDFENISLIEGDSASKLHGLRKFDTKEATVIQPGEYHYEHDKDTSVPWKQIHRSRIQQFDNYVIYAEVVGNTGHVLANIINLDIPSTNRTESGILRMNRHLSGKFLVSKIKHVITADKYTQILELRKGCLRKV